MTWARDLDYNISEESVQLFLTPPKTCATTQCDTCVITELVHHKLVLLFKGCTSFSAADLVRVVSYSN